MVDHLPVEIMTVIIIILIIERETVEERTPMQVIEVVDKWLEHPWLTGVAINHLIRFVHLLFAMSGSVDIILLLQADYRRNNNNSNTYNRGRCT